ncbi:hypothetical protein SISNIDRAFT_412073 [Sistotremastrum niveocremeum HHB9708]|uniref:Large ribosomal subunit protein bL32m n=1 Tax=Sistotremastrum niveocremeum HHB9708 TaxID=1314777 RepID=A0A164U7T7_9AGAM|nr:hypothetical protein SISNIDRAFT_412073 [Sistotremastrum niveocremeum HHB9708]
MAAIAFRSTSLLSQFTQSLHIPIFQALWELFPPFLLAVPKKKTSHSRKRMRSANKGLQDKTSKRLFFDILDSADVHIGFVNCPGCGNVKLAHHICASCYSQISREWKAQQRVGNSDAESIS